MRDAKQKKLKKKLFVSGAMVVLSALLLIVVSFGQYRIKVSGQINMPEAAEIETSIIVEPDLTTHGDDTEIVLTDLQPGDSAKVYASDSNINRRFKLTVTNATGTNVSKVGIKYSISIETANRIPLEFYLVPASDTNSRFASKYEGNGNTGIYKFYDNNYEKKFSIEKTNEVKSCEYYIYTGWDNSGSIASTTNHQDSTARDKTGASYRKEVEVINVKVNVVSDEYEPYYADNKEWYDSKIVSPSNNSGGGN